MQAVQTFKMAATVLQINAGYKGLYGKRFFQI